VFSWSMLGRESSEAFLLPRPEKGVSWLISRWTHSARWAVVALVVRGLVDICRKFRTGSVTWKHLSSSPTVLISWDTKLEILLNVKHYLTWCNFASKLQSVSARYIIPFCLLVVDHNDAVFFSSQVRIGLIWNPVIEVLKKTTCM